jgi:ketosteroid isomerase-like protein
MTASEPATDSARLRAFRAGHAEFVRAFNEGDFERACAGFRDDYEQHFPAGFTERMVRGRDAWRQFFEEFREDVEGWRITPREYIEAGPRTFVVGVENTGVGRASGLQAAIEVWDVVEVDEDDRPFRVREFLDRDEALAAAGLDAHGED